MMKILHLTLKKKWFDLIASGEKVFEYREYKPYWQKRISFQHYDEIHFKNGYAKDVPFMRVVYNGYSVIDENVDMKMDNGEILEKSKAYFVLYLGKVLETKNHE